MRSTDLPWRDYLTPEEREIFERAEAARVVWEELNIQRPRITSRAIARARYARMVTERKASKPKGKAR